MAETIINELSDHWVTAAFTDRAGDPETPSAVSYSIADAIDGTVLATGTATPLSSVEIQVASTYNAIRHGQRFERRKINVLATYGSGQLANEQSWLVRNLGFTGST